MSTTERTIFDASSDTIRAGISWSAVFAGAAAAASLSLILLVLGTGLGFSAISPWQNSGISAAAIGISSILWLTFTQIAASGMGGYLAGRLRIRWSTVHIDEIYFRDTAHGFLAWAIASLLAAALLGSLAGNVISSGVSAGAALGSGAIMAGGAGTGAAANRTMSPRSGNGGLYEGVLGYATDALFRTDQSKADATGSTDASVRIEAGRIFANALRSESLPHEDQQYLAQVVAKRTGLSQADADNRVSELFNNAHVAITNAEQSARQAADKARKAAAYTALWMFVALLSGAFVASLSATFGGKQRDRVAHTGSIAV